MASSRHENDGHGPPGGVELESRPVPLPESDDLTRAGQRSGEGLASILPYLMRSLRSKPSITPPLPEKPRRLRGRRRPGP